MKLFKTLLIVIPCLILLTVIIIALPGREPLGLDELSVAVDEDAPRYVTNSKMSFFYKNDQLRDYREQKKPDPVDYFRMTESVVTTDFTKNDISILPDPETTYTGPTSVIVYDDGKTAAYDTADERGYHLLGGGVVQQESAFEVSLDSSILGGSTVLPYRVERGKKYYAAFTGELQSIYFEIESDNEFFSVMLDELSGRVEYTLLDSALRPIKNGWNNGKPSVEIQYKGRGAAKYYLKLTGSFAEALAPFCVSLPSDGNEWEWQMIYSSQDSESTCAFDYYGDEDYFVLPPAVTDNPNRSVLRFTKAEFGVNVVVYNKAHTAIGQYVYTPGVTESISLYGLADPYAIGVYSYDGASSGSSCTFVFEFTDITLLDVETYGFSLSPGFTDDNDYYTASVSSLSDKKITDLMYSVKNAQVAISVTQQCGMTVAGKLGEPLPLQAGRNTVTLSVEAGGIEREITIVISDKKYDLSYGFMLAAANVMDKSGSGSSKIAAVSKNERVLILEDDGSSAYVKIQICTGSATGKVGYVARSSMFSGYTATTMPASYASGINALKEAHPNWKFTFVKTGKDFESYVDSQLGASSMLNGKQADRETVKHYVDPRNFLNEQSVFMFEKQIYKEGAYLKSGVLSVWNDQTFASYIMEAGVSTGMSPYFIGARAALESGRGKSKLAMGEITGCEGYYNFYGIGANDSNPSNGGLVAKENNWNSKRRAIIEGAAWIKKQYISCGQNTIYFMKFCFVPNREWHQYMTDIAAPAKDAQNYYKAHLNGGTLNSEIEFIIPVFENMN